jgi:hypothetical protein
MALFFDARWFDARLAARGLDRNALGAACGLDALQIAEVFKDQRELAPDQIAIFALLLGEDAGVVARAAGISTPGWTSAPPSPVQAANAQDSARIAALEARVSALETALVNLVETFAEQGPNRPSA